MGRGRRRANPQPTDQATGSVRSGCLAKLQSLLPSASPAERRVLEYISQKPQSVVYLTITELAEITGTSEGTVVRVCQHAGYVGFQDLKLALASDLGRLFHSEAEDINATDPMAEILRKTMKSHVRVIEDTLAMLDLRAFQSAVALLAEAHEVVFAGVGTSGFVALDAQNKFLSLDIHALAFTDSHIQLAAAALLGPGDVAVGISHSGATIDVISVLQIAKAAGASTVAITSYPRSPIVSHADICLLTASREPSIRRGAITSRIAQLAIIDALFNALVVRNYAHSVKCLKRVAEAVKSKRW